MRLPIFPVLMRCARSSPDVQAVHCSDMLIFCRNTGDAGRKGISPALPFLGQFDPALPCKGADRAVPATAQAHCHSSWSVLEAPTGQGTYIGPLAACLETAQGPLQNSPNGCCISPHQHQQLAAAYRLQEQAPLDSPVQKRGSMSPSGNNVQTHSTLTGFRAAPSSRNKQQHLRSATTGSRAALQNSTDVFQSPTEGTAAGAIFLPAHDPYLRADTSCPKGQPKPPFPAGLLEGSCANDNLLSQAQAAQLERFRATPNSLECRLVFPHGSRSHKRPKLEDRLKEVSFFVTQTQLTRILQLLLHAVVHAPYCRRIYLARTHTGRWSVCATSLLLG